MDTLTEPSVTACREHLSLRAPGSGCRRRSGQRRDVALYAQMLRGQDTHSPDPRSPETACPHATQGNCPRLLPGANQQIHKAVSTQSPRQPSGLIV